MYKEEKEIYVFLLNEKRNISKIGREREKEKENLLC